MMRRRIEILLALILCFLSVRSGGDIKDFAPLEAPELFALRQKAQDRISLIDQYENALKGVSPSENSDLRAAAYYIFATSSQSLRESAVLETQNTKQCHQYVRNVKELTIALQESYTKWQRINPLSRVALVLRTRIEILTIFLASEFALAEANAEGGLTSITAQATPCYFRDRTSWKSKSSHLKKVTTYLTKVWWGQRGLTSAFPVSSKLLQAMNVEAEREYRWAIPRIVSTTMIATALGSALTLVLFPEGSIVIAPASRLVLHLTGISLFATLGAYQGLRMAENQLSAVPQPEDPWTQLQVAIEKVLPLDDTETQSYYSLAVNLENGILRLNQDTVRAFQPQIRLAKERFGSLAAARALAVTKLREIDFVIEEKHLTTKVLN